NASRPAGCTTFRSSSDCVTGRCRKKSSIRSILILERGLRAPKTKRGRRAARPALCARLAGHVALAAQANGDVVASGDAYPVGMGRWSAEAAGRAQELRSGLPPAAFAGGATIDKEIETLVRRLARHGLMEYVLRGPAGADQVVIEPQVADYWPRPAPLA